MKFFNLQYLHAISCRFAWRGAGRIGCAAVILVLALIVAFKVSQQISGRGRLNILLIVVDCLRAEVLDDNSLEFLAPNIFRVKNGGFFFSQAYSNAPWTRPAVASLLSGLRVGQHTADGLDKRMPDRVLTIAEALAEAGYQTAFYNGGNFHLQPVFNVPQGFDVYRYSGGRNGLTLINWFDELLRERREKPFFAYLHFMDLHSAAPRLKKADGPEERLLKGNADQIYDKLAATGLGEDEKAALREDYNLRVSRLDSHIGRLLAVLNAQDLLDRTLVVLTADHGEELFEHGLYEHGHSMYEEVVRVPLVFYGGGVSPGRSDKLVQHIDIAPTLARVAGARLPVEELSGRDILAEGGGSLEGTRRIFIDGSLYGLRKKAMVEDNWKLIWNIPGAGSSSRLQSEVKPEWELFDLSRDPGERSNLAAEEPDLLREMQSVLQEGSSQNMQEGEQIELQEESIKELRTLGYL